MKDEPKKTGALSNPKDYLDNIIKYSPVMIYWKDKNSVYLGCNDQFINIVGYENCADIVGKTDFDLPWHSQAKKFRADDKKVLDKECPLLDMEDIIFNKHGEIRYVITNITPLRNTKNEVVGILGIATDITEKKIIENELRSSKATQAEFEMLNNIIKYSPDWIYWKDKNSVHLGSNEQFAKAAGLTSRFDMVGKTDYDLPWKDRADKYVADDKEVIKSGKPRLNIEDTVLVHDNIELIVISNKVPLRNNTGKIIGILGIATDITSQKLMEEGFRKAKEAAEAANIAKTEFIANMSHDIRTPLTGVIGLSEILENTLQNKEQKENAHLLHNSGEELLDMLNDILDDIRAEHTSETDIHKEEFDLHHCIQALVRLELPTTKLKHLDLQVNIADNVPQYIVSDRKKIHRILLNLVGNAIKFTQSGNITINLKCLEITKSSVHLQFGVSDTGIGIPEQLQAQVFDRFFRVTSSYKGLYTGHGLGLHIAQSYVSLLGGHITLTSEEGVGSTFYFDLQCNIGTGENTELTPIPLPQKLNTSDLNSNKPHLLLVEDNPTALRVLESIVSSAGCCFTSASDGEKALELVKSMTFDLVITDIGLPGISGNELTKLIRASEVKYNKPSIPIIGLTGHAKETAKPECMASGMNDVFSKPASSSMIQDLVKQHVVALDAEQPKDNTNPPDTLGVDLPNTEEELFQLEQFPIFDTEFALKQVGDLSLLFQIIRSALSDEVQEDIKQMERAYAQKDWGQIQSLAHKIKGGTVYIGTRRFQHACQYLERYYKAGHQSQLDKLYHQLLTINHETNEELEAWLKRFAS